MIGTKKKLSLYVIAAMCGFIATIVTYSCSTDEYEYSDNTGTEMNGMARMRASLSEYTLIDSIANSDEFWEFEMSSQLLAEKVDAYTSSLSEKEYDELMEKLNNDEYAEEFIKEANLEKELQQLEKAKEGLLQRTGFLKLNEEERTQLFMQHAEGQTGKKLLKTRAEGGDTNECQKQKEAAYKQAKADYDNAIATICKSQGPFSTCYAIEAAHYRKRLRDADRAYENCINNR